MVSCSSEDDPTEPTIVPKKSILTKEQNGIRIGDTLNYTTFKRIEPGISGDNAIWNFSDLEFEPGGYSHILEDGKIIGLKKDEYATYIVIYREAPIVDDTYYEFGDSQIQLSDVPPKSIITSNFKYFFTDKNGKSEYYTQNTYYQIKDNNQSIIGLENSYNLVNYSPPFLELNFPVEFNKKDSSDFKVDRWYCNTINWLYSGYTSYHADGYGELILPNKDTLSNVLRIKHTATYIIDEEIVAIHDTYSWYAKGYRYPVLKMTFSQGHAMLIYKSFIGQYLPPKERI